jgi:hypothetical protein
MRSLIRNVVALVTSIAVVLAGLGIVFIADVGGDMRFFGWLLAGVGVLGLLSWWWVVRQRDSRDPPGRPR